MKNFDSVEVSSPTCPSAFIVFWGVQLFVGGLASSSLQFRCQGFTAKRCPWYPTRIHIRLTYHLRSKLLYARPFSFLIQSPHQVSQPSGTYSLLIFNFPLTKMTRVELPVLAFLAVLSLFAILPLHLNSRNIPFLFVIAWLLVCNIIQGIDAIVWADNALIRAEGWCDFGE